MNQTSYERGFEKGFKIGFKIGFEMGTEKTIEWGMEKARRAIALELLEERFGPLSPAVQQRLSQMSPDQLISLRKSILRAQSLRELGLED